METLSDKMKREAVERGLCDQWTGEWEENATKSQMVNKFVRGIDFCIKNNWPTIEQMEEFKEEANKQDVYINQYVALTNPHNVVLNGKCNAVITVTSGSTTIWVRHDSICTVVVSGGALVFVSCLDNAKVNVTCSFFSKAYTYKYSQGVEITTKGDVKQRERIDFYK